MNENKGELKPFNVARYKCPEYAVKKKLNVGGNTVAATWGVCLRVKSGTMGATLCYYL